MRHGSDARLLEPRSDAEDAMTLPSRFALTVLLLCLCGPAGAQMSEQVNGGVPLKAIRVTLLGTASGFTLAWLGSARLWRPAANVS